MLERVIIVSAVASFFILLISKVGIREWVQVNATKLLSELASCDFCLSFWVNCVICLTLSIVMRDWTYLLIPVPATPLTRLLIS